MTYDAWKRAIDAILLKEIGLTQDDLPDWLSKDAYNAGLTPLEAANECLSSFAPYIDEFIIDEA